MQHLKTHPQLNQVRVAIISIFVIVLGMSYINSARIKAKQQQINNSVLKKQESKETYNKYNTSKTEEVLLTMEESEYTEQIVNDSKKINTTVKTIKPTIIYNKADYSKVKGSLPKGEKLLILSESNNKKWLEVKHNENIIWLEANQLSLNK
ncbi:MAG: hypothetical protein GY793_06975 [Proteobacteria bacterium]|nr:hypothetical protein [Pseudomonadota bacterium]